MTTSSSNPKARPTIAFSSLHPWSKAKGMTLHEQVQFLARHGWLVFDASKPPAMWEHVALVSPWPQLEAVVLTLESPEILR